MPTSRRSRSCHRCVGGDKEDQDTKSFLKRFRNPFFFLRHVTVFAACGRVNSTFSNAPVFTDVSDLDVRESTPLAFPETVTSLVSFHPETVTSSTSRFASCSSWQDKLADAGSVAEESLGSMSTVRSFAAEGRESKEYANKLQE